MRRVLILTIFVVGTAIAFNLGRRVPVDEMYPTTSVHDLTSRDRKTAMLLYSLPPGSVRGPAAH